MTERQHASLIRRLAGRLHVSVAVVVGVLVLVGGVAAAAVVTVLLASPQGNDSLTGAEPIAGFEFDGTLEGAPAGADEIAAGIAADGQYVVWFTWTPAKHGWAYITPTEAAGANPEVKVFTGTEISALTRVDQPSSSSGPVGVSAPVKKGTDYLLAVVGDAVPFDMTIFQPDGPGGLVTDPPGGPTSGKANDEPTDAIELGSAATASAGAAGAAQVATEDTLGGATAAVGEPAVGGQSAEHSVWFSWHVPTGGGQLTVTVAPAFGAPAGFRLGSWTATPGGGFPTPTGGGGTNVVLSGAGGELLFVSVDGPEDYYTLTVAASGIAGPDTTPPVIVCSPPAPSDPWATGDEIAVPCAATDAGTGLVDPADASFVLVSANDEGVETADAVTNHRTVCDNAGNCADAGPFDGLRVDRKAPTAACDPVSGGWTATDQTVRCVASDDGSGLADPGDAERLTTTSVPPDTEQTVSIPARDVCDLAGNCTTLAAIDGIQVDRKGPAVTCDPLPAGVQKANVTIGCSAADDGSGLGAGAQSSFTVATTVEPGEASGAAETQAETICDVVGNCTTVGPFAVAIDMAPPSAPCDVPTGWNSADVSIPCTASDVGTGLAPGTPSPFTLAATLPAGEESDEVASSSLLVCDVAGNCTAAGPFTVQIDRKAPAVSCAAPLEAWSKGPVLVDCGATDDGSGVAGDAAKGVRLTADLPAGQEGVMSTDSVEVCDNTGNCATAGPVANVKVDNRAPAVICGAPAGGQGSEAHVDCTASDGGSGLNPVPGASFALVTDVGEGNADPAAQTGQETVCDLAGNCTQAGPFTVAVDRTTTPATGPAVFTPAKVTVLAAVNPPAPVPAPYELPGVPPGSSITCQPAPGTVLREGWSVITCDARDEQGGGTTAAFLLVVKSVPALADTGPVVKGAPWRALGIGFAPGSAVAVEWDGDTIGAGTAGGDGRAAIDFTVPANANPARHLLVLRGTDGDGNPLIVVSFLDTLVDGQSSPPPVLPPSGPEVPPDPTPVPPLPTFTRLDVPSTTTTTTPGQTTTTTTPGQTTTTVEGGSSTTTSGGGTGPGGAGGAGGAGGGSGQGAGGQAQSGSGASGGSGSAVLPVTGIALGFLLILALGFIASGGSLFGLSKRGRRAVTEGDSDDS